MKVKMVKMGSNYTKPINYRMRGIVVTEDNKHLFVEISCANSPDIKSTLLSPKEYNLKYPNSQYVSVDFCFRVDRPEDFYKCLTKEYCKYTRTNLLKIPYTKDGIIEFLQKLNKSIDDIELVDDYYIDKYCEENGFFELYDDRLKHSKKILSIENLSPNINDNSRIQYQYTCYAADGTEFSETSREIANIRDIVNEYGIRNVKPLAVKYVKKICSVSNNPKLTENFNQLLKNVFDNNKKELKNNLDKNNDDYDYGY